MNICHNSVALKNANVINVFSGYSTRQLINQPAALSFGPGTAVLSRVLSHLKTGGLVGW
jgi:hypothetical protein